MLDAIGINFQDLNPPDRLGQANRRIIRRVDLAINSHVIGEFQRLCLGTLAVTLHLIVACHLEHQAILNRERKQLTKHLVDLRDVATCHRLRRGRGRWLIGIGEKLEQVRNLQRFLDRMAVGFREGELRSHPAHRPLTALADHQFKQMLHRRCARPQLDVFEVAQLDEFRRWQRSEQGFNRKFIRQQVKGRRPWEQWRRLIRGRLAAAGQEKGNQ